MNAGPFNWQALCKQLLVANPWLLTFLSALLYFLCFPDTSYSWLVWCAFVPLQIVCHQVSTCKAFLFGQVWGMVAYLFIFNWIFVVKGFGFYQAAPLTLYLGVYGAFFCAGLSLTGRDNLPFIVTAPMLWVLLEYLKHHAGLLSFPMASLAHTQYRNVWFIQIAAWTGEYGLSFWIIVVNSAFADYFVRKKRWPVLLVLIIVVGLHLAGKSILTRPGPQDSITIAVVQPSILRSERANEQTLNRTVDRLVFYTKRAAAQKPDLVVWPETAILDLYNDLELKNRIVALVNELDLPLLTGASEFIKFSRSSPDRAKEPIFTRELYNSVFFIEPNHPLIVPYRKMKLVPFAEYMPFEKTVSWPKWLVKGYLGITPGSVYHKFQIGDILTICPIICWEGLFSEFVRHMATNKCSVIVQVTNNNWFGLSSASQLQNISSVFRAVETAKPVIVASNCGPSLFIDHQGQIIASTNALFQEAVLVKTVRTCTDNTFYTHYGDLFVLLNILLLFWRLIITLKVNQRIRDRGAEKYNYHGADKKV